MNVRDAADKLGAEIVVGADLVREVLDFYAGDLLSHCMSKARTDGLWFTIMNNVNVAAVSTLCDVAAIVVCEGVTPDAALVEKCRYLGINLLVSPLDIFRSCVCFA